MMHCVNIEIMCFYYGGTSLETTIDKEELVKWVKGTSALSTALAVMGETGSEVPPEADYVIGQILNMIANTIG